MESVKIFAPVVREFLVGIAQNEIVAGKKYSERIEINDGGYNSYIGLCVDVDDYNKARKKDLQGIRLFRHSNSALLQGECWGFALGGVCNPHCDNADIPIEFSTYGRDVNDAEREANVYFKKLLSLVRKSTAAIRVEVAESAEAEKASLLARLEELSKGEKA